MIPVENDCELMDRLYDFLAPTLEQEDLFLIRSPVCLTLDVRACMQWCSASSFPESDHRPGHALIILPSCMHACMRAMVAHSLLRVRLKPELIIPPLRPFFLPD